jgi:hypothetical protein
MNRRVLGWLVAGGMASTALARAASPPPADFTFTVPVQLDSIPLTIQSVTVQCEVFDGAGQSLGKAGAAWAYFKTTLHRSIVVPVAVGSGKDAAAASSYTCKLLTKDTLHGAIPFSLPPAGISPDGKFETTGKIPG